tara:strand:+ start:109 stop:228 length:120 start_codon:yes stop_codon:yes gene_type:complete
VVVEAVVFLLLLVQEVQVVVGLVLDVHLVKVLEQEILLQ